ncbi:MAG: hypothetical protein AAF907_01310, partial [Planctomycetota bacterium]
MFVQAGQLEVLRVPDVMERIVMIAVAVLALGMIAVAVLAVGVLVVVMAGVAVVSVVMIESENRPRSRVSARHGGAGGGGNQKSGGDPHGESEQKRSDGPGRYRRPRRFTTDRNA